MDRSLECIDCGKPAETTAKNGWPYCNDCLKLHPPKSCANGACPSCCRCGDCLTFLAGEEPAARQQCTCGTSDLNNLNGFNQGIGFKMEEKNIIDTISSIIDESEPLSINEAKLSELQGKGNFDWPATKHKSGKGAHGGGTSYEQLSNNSEFTDHTNKAHEHKKKPGKSTENEMDPGEGEQGEKPNTVKPPKGFTQSKTGLPKEKDKPGKVTKNLMPGESMDRALDIILEGLPAGGKFGDEPEPINEPQFPDKEDVIKSKQRKIKK